MKFAALLAGILIASPAAALVHQKSSQDEGACVAENLKNRIQFQNKLAGACEDMCKEVGAYPKCDCPAFVPPDATPGKVTGLEEGGVGSAEKGCRASVKERSGERVLRHFGSP